MTTTNPSYWDRIVNFVRSFLKHEPALTVGGVTSVISVVLTWVNTNKITSWRQAVSVAAPVVFAYAIRTFVVPNAKYVAAVTTTTNLATLLDAKGIAAVAAAPSIAGPDLGDATAPLTKEELVEPDDVAAPPQQS